MPRLRQVGKDAAHPNAQAIYKLLFKDRDPVKQPGTDTGTPGNWWTVFAVVPDAFDHAVAGFQFYRGKRKLDPKLRELGQTRAGWARGSQFVSVADCYEPVERAVLAYTDAMVLQGGRVADGIFAALKKHLSDEEILEFTYIVGMYDMHAMISKALRLEYDDVDDRIVEIAAPSDASTDVMRMVDQEKK